MECPTAVVVVVAVAVTGSGEATKMVATSLALLHTSHIDVTKMVPHLHTSHKAGDIDGCHLTALTYHMNHIDGCHLTAAATLALAHKQHKCHLQFATTQAT